MSFSTQLLIIFGLIIGSAFFSLSEISLAAARRIKLKVLADEGDSRAAAILALQEKPGHFFTAIQIGLNTVAILAGIFGESSLTPYFKQLLALAGTGSWIEPIASVCSFLTITSLFVVLADLIPKRLAMAAPEAFALHLVAPMQAFIRLLKPAVWLFNALSDRLIALFGLPAQRVNDITFDDIHAVVDAGAQAGVLQRQEYHLIENVFELESRLVSSAMTPRENIVYFTLQDTENTIRQQIALHTHSKFLVCNEEIDRTVGYADSKDLLNRIINNEPLVLKDAPWLKPTLTIPDTLTLSELITQFRASREDFAIVINEYALVVGLITLNDVMSTVMGDLVNNHQSQIVKRDENSWLIDGLAPLEDVMRALEIEEFPEDSNYETLAGFMMFSLRRIPKLTDSVSHAGFKFEVIDIDNLRIDQLLVTRLQPTP